MATFVLLKQYWFAPHLNALNGVSTVGLSYIMFRTVALLVEAGETVPLRWSEAGRLLRWQFSCFTLLAGPVHHYADFCEQDSRVGAFVLEPGECARDLLRLTTGLVKVLLVAPVAYLYFNRFQHAPDWATAAIAVLFLGWVYANFSGYMDIVAGAASLFGYDLPENFDEPWMARDLIDFWARWHITVSHFFRDYLFYPLLMGWTRWTGRPSGLGVATVVYALVFFLIGLWHGTSPMFLWLGVLIAAGVVLNRVMPASGGHAAGAFWVLYFALICVTIWPTSCDMVAASQVWSRLGSASGLCGLLVAWAGLVGTRWCTLALRRVWWRTTPAWMMQLAIAVQVVLLAFVYRLLAEGFDVAFFYEKF